jgi:SprT protein
MSLQPKDILARYFPEETIDQVYSLLIKNAIQLKFTRERRSKLGDFRMRTTGSRPVITLNGNLEKYFAYLVFLHEIAHFYVRNKYGRSASPHGKQWKEEFGSLLRQALFLGMIPEVLKAPLYNFSLHVKATFNSDAALYNALKSMNSKHVDEITVEDIPANTVFVAANGRLFRKEEKLRKRIRCYCFDNKRRYLFHPAAVIKPVDNNEVLSKHGVEI